MDCPEERQSCHHTPAAGYGVVADEETLILAVFDGDVDEITKKPKPDVFKKLNQDISVARHKYTTSQIITENIIKPKEQNGRVWLGTSTVVTKLLRKIPAKKDGKTIGKAVCVIDKVEITDFDGHASIRYSNCYKSVEISQKNLAKARQFIMLDVASAFSPLVAKT